VDQGFIPTMGMTMIAGRNFSENSAADEQSGVIINETAAKKFGWDDPIGRTIRYKTVTGEFTTGTVCGVVKDFHLASLYRLIEPLCITNNPRQLDHLLVRIAAGTETEAIGRIRAGWNAVFPDQPFGYSFLDQTYDQYFRVLERVLSVLSAFALLAVLIACLGTFALAAYATERRTKEIGIRKVMGASTFRIMLSLNRDIMKLVVIAIALAWLVLKIPWGDPHAFIPYLAEISPAITLFAMLSVVVIAFVTVSYHSVRAATANPVEAMRYE